jgi:hypothetical protein
MTPMKKLVIIFTLALTAAVGRAALPQPDLLAQIHFAGAQKLSAGKDAAIFTNEFGSLEALALRAQTAEKVSVWLAGWLQRNVGPGAADGATSLRPLLADLEQSEWFFDSRLEPNGKVDAALAIKLNAARVQLWQTTLKSFFPLATFKSAGGWLYFDAGTGTQKLSDGLAQKISAPDAAWLSLDVNWPRLARWYPRFRELGLPETKLQLTASGADLHVDGKLFFPENLAMNLEPWRVPTNTLHQPFISLTAVRGFAAWLKTQPWAQPYQLTPAPNQYFTWALPQVPYQTFAAIPVADATDSLSQAYARLQPVINAKNGQGAFMTPFTLEKTNHQITLVGAPFVAPYLQTIREPAGQFLLAGAFPNTPRSKPLPPELFQRLASPNLVFYHWEITAERWPQVLQLSQLSLLLTSHRQLGGESASIKWIQKITPSLGNTVTEITQTGPAEMTFTRKAPGLFTAMELFTLGSWLEDPKFPALDLKLPPRPKKPIRPRPDRLMSPAPAPAPVK